MEGPLGLLQTIGDRRIDLANLVCSALIKSLWALLPYRDNLMKFNNVIVDSFYREPADFSFSTSADCWIDLTVDSSQELGSLLFNDC